MKKSTLFKLAMMGIAASSSSAALEGSDISNTSSNSALLAAGCGGSSSVRQGSGSGCNASSRPSNPGYYTEAQANGSHSCGSRSSSPTNGTVATHGCSSPNGCSNQTAPTNTPPTKVAAPTTQPANPTTSNQQASSGSRYQYERTANAPVAPALSEQDKIKQAAEKAKIEATKNAAQQAPTNVPNNNMMPKSLTPGNTGSSTGTGSVSPSK